MAYHTEKGEHVGYDERRMIQLIAAALTTAADEVWERAKAEIKGLPTVGVGWRLGVKAVLQEDAIAALETARKE